MKANFASLKWVFFLCFLLVVPNLSFAQKCSNPKDECVGYVRGQTGIPSQGPYACNWAGKSISGYKWHDNSNGSKTKPASKDIVVWKCVPGTTPYGHVAIINKVKKIDSKNYSATLSESNWRIHCKVTKDRTIKIKKKNDKYKFEASGVAGWYEKK